MHFHVHPSDWENSDRTAGVNTVNFNPILSLRTTWTKSSSATSRWMLLCTTNLRLPCAIINAGNEQVVHGVFCGTPAVPTGRWAFSPRTSIKCTQDGNFSVIYNFLPIETLGISLPADIIADPLTALQTTSSVIFNFIP